MAEKEEPVWAWLWKLLVGAIVSGLVLLFIAFVNHTMEGARDLRNEVIAMLATHKTEATQLVKDQVTLVLKDNIDNIREKITIIEEKQTTFKEETKNIKLQLIDLKELASLKEKVINLEKWTESRNVKDEQFKKDILDIRDRITKAESKIEK